MPNSTLHIRIVSPQQLLLDTQALSISSKNLQGPFDVLAEHANFITMIENTPIIIRVDKGKPLTFTFPLAIMLVSNNQVNIYTYILPDLEKK